MNEDNSLWAKLKALREYTAQHGVLVGAQIEQLKLWGALAFQDVPRTGVEIRVNTESYSITYALTGGKLSPLNIQAKLVAGLDRSVHELLGDAWRLTVEHDGQSIYEGRAVKTRGEQKNDRRAAHRARTRRHASR